MKYKISVPVRCAALDNYGAGLFVSQLKEIGASRVFLCPSGDINLWKNHEEEIASLKRNIDIMKSNGFETGVWVWAFQYAGGSFTYMRNPKGVDSKTSVCPTDREYTEMMGGFVEEAAKAGADIFMFDDDYRYSFIDNGFCCCCDNHLKMISSILGEDVSLETMEKHLLYGGKNRYRDAFLEANGKALADFAKEMRRHLDNVNPEIRMGFCTCISSWDIDGIHPDSVASLLAGGTVPFYRLIGAPYWAPEKFWGNRLGDVIELTRLESSRRVNRDIEIFSEGDAYPRPRYKTPSAYVEGFDTALRASGCTDGILKYIIDYSAHPLTETGYLSRHKANIPLYGEIENMFSGKASTGIRIYDKPDKYSSITIPAEIEGDFRIQDLACNCGARMITACSVPTVYEGYGCAGVAFCEDMRAVPDEALSKGIITDIAGCRILMERGIDTGIKDIGETYHVGREKYLKDGNIIGLGAGFTCRKTEISEKAAAESYFIGDSETSVGSFRYENEAGQRFLIFCAEVYFNNESIYRQYPRAKQLISAVPWLCGAELPAVITGNPDLYVQVRENKDSVAVGLWNFFADDIPEPSVKVLFDASSVRTINCTAEIRGREIRLSRIEPFGFAAFEIFR